MTWADVTPEAKAKLAEWGVREGETLGEHIARIHAVPTEPMPQHAPRKLDIACGQNKQKGFRGIDLRGDADIIWDLFEYPWPIKTSSVQEVFCSHFVEHIPHDRPGWDKDGFFLFFEEVQRICREGAQVQVIHPYGKNSRAIWDPTHQRSIHETTWSYLDPAWRQANKLDHYNTTCDFEVVTMNGVGIADDIAARNPQMQAYAQAHYWDVIADMQVILKVRK